MDSSNKNSLAVALKIPGLFWFKFLIPQFKFGVLTGEKGVVINGLRNRTQCELRWSERDSVFPGSRDRVFLVTAPVLPLLVRGCSAVVDLLGNDHGRDGKQASSAYVLHTPTRVLLLYWGMMRSLRL